MYGAAAVFKRKYEELKGKKLFISPHAGTVLLLTAHYVGLVDYVTGGGVIMSKLLSECACLIDSGHIVPDCNFIVINASGT